MDYRPVIVGAAVEGDPGVRVDLYSDALAARRQLEEELVQPRSVYLNTGAPSTVIRMNDARYMILAVLSRDPKNLAFALTSAAGP